MQTVILTELSFSDLLTTNLLRAGAIAGMGYLFAHYNENPPVIIGAMLICFLVFLFFGEDVIRIYPDKVVASSGSLLNYLLNKKGRTFWLKDLRRAYLPQENKERPGTYAKGLIVLLAAISPTHRRRSSFGHPVKLIILCLKNGNEAVLPTQFSDHSRQRIVDTINALLAKQN